MKRGLLAAVGFAVVLVAIVSVALGRPTSRDEHTENIFGSLQPTTPSANDARAVEVGVRFSSDIDGLVTGVRFYKGASNTGRHTGKLWTDTGEMLAKASFEDETPEGWQTAYWHDPVAIRAGQTYRASYFAPSGGYALEEGGLASPFQSGHLNVPASGGVFTYDPDGFPTEIFKNSNYFVDILFVADTTGKFAKGERTGPPELAQPSSATSTAGTPSANQPSPDSSRPPWRPRPTTLNLPKVRWEGGSKYWSKFKKADEAGWTDPTFFPIVVWYNGVSSDAEVSYDKSLGINSYIGMWEGTPYSLFEKNGVYWIGGPLNETFTSQSKNWVGDFLDDEVDGRFSPAEGFKHLEKIVDKLEGDGRFKYANYTQMIMSNDMVPADAERYVNDFTDAVSIDMYFYTVPYCSLRPYRNTYIAPVRKENCRTASSYGKTMQSLRARDAADGDLQALWQFVELVNGGPGEGPFTANITGDQLKGAVMSSVINEARGIVYFNQSFTGPCTGSALFRQSQGSPAFCGNDQVNAAKTVNLQIHELAPVINTRSYRYDFENHTDTMLKAADGSIYLFAMVDGDSQPGRRTFKLPSEVQGRTASVLFEDRSIEIDKSGQFTDTFESEYSYHIYEIKK